MNGEDLEYIIGDEYLEDTQVPEGMEIVEVSSLTWAVFPCNGPISENMPKLNQEIFLIGCLITKNTKLQLDII